MWHASTAALAGRQVAVDMLRRFAMHALRNVGDPTAGQWEEFTGRAYHVRRRLTRRELKFIGEALDIRGTEEQERRWLAVRDFLPAAIRDYKG